jgi:CBS domain-containing protein
MRVSEAMTKNVRMVAPSQTIQDAAILMAQIDSGILPVADNERLVGMITDRDIAMRAVARGKGPQTRVSDVMTPDIKYCFSDQSLDEVMANMSDIQLRRLPVIDRNKRLVGILSLGDVAQNDEMIAAGALRGISMHGPH